MTIASFYAFGICVHFVSYSLMMFRGHGRFAFTPMHVAITAALAVFWLPLFLLASWRAMGRDMWDQS